MPRTPFSRAGGALLATLAVVGATSTAAAQRAAPRAEARPDARDVPAVSAPVADVRYDVTVDRAAASARTIKVAMSFTTGGAEPVVLALPAWTPGAYELSWFSRWVENFQATAQGRPLAWDKLDYETWRIRPAGAKAVTVTFDYRADTLDNAMSWTRPDFALFNGTNLFLYPVGRGFDWGATVAVHTEPDWLVATGMAAGRLPKTYTATNYHDLVDMPFFVGRFDLDSTRISDRWVRYATYPVGSVGGATRREVWTQLAKMIPVEAAVFGEVPWATYTVMQIADSSYGGASGLEHQNTHVDVINPLALGYPVNPFVPSLYAHEIFHSWNVKRLRPAELWPYRYDRPQPTPWLWVSEGITDYYADLAEVRGGVVDSAGFFELTSGKMNEVAAAPPVALEDASLSTWVHPVDGTQYIYYPKGSLAGLMLDIMIRDASDNARSLDDVMRELYRTTYKQGTGFTGDQFWAAVSRAANGRSFTDVYQRYVDGHEPYPWAQLLPLAGMRVVTDTAREPRLGVFTGQDSGGVRVTAIEPGSAAAEAGLREGDYILALGDIAVTDAAFGTKFRAQYGSAAENTALPLRVRRGTETLTLTSRLRFTVRTQSRVEPDAAAGQKAVRIRNGILRGRTG